MGKKEPLLVSHRNWDLVIREWALEQCLSGIPSAHSGPEYVGLLRPTDQGPCRTVLALLKNLEEEHIWGCGTLFVSHFGLGLGGKENQKEGGACMYFSTAALFNRPAHGRKEVMVREKKRGN